MIPVITVDGPAASGKTSLTQALAVRLSYKMLISGILYRGVAYRVQTQKIPMDSRDGLLTAIRSLHISFQSDGRELKVLLDGDDVSSAISTETCAELASQLATMEDVRAALIDYQRSFCVLPGLVAEGRDMGTVVFPDAGLKIYLDASVSSRARRRYEQLRQKGIDVKIEKVFQQINKRDECDRLRTASPLKPAADAVLVNNTHQTIEQTIEEVLELKKSIYG